MMNMVSIMRSVIFRSPKLWTMNIRRFLNEGSTKEMTSSVLDSVPKLEEDADVEPEIGTTGLDYEGQLEQWDEIARRSLLFSFNLDKETHSKLYNHLRTFGELAYHIPIDKQPKKSRHHALVVFQQDEALHLFQETALPPAKIPISRQQIFLPEKYLSGLPVGEVHEELRPQKKKPMEKVYNDLHFAKDGITGQIDLLYNSLKVQDTDILKRCFVRGQMQHLLEKFFPHLAVQPFGSTMCGLSSAYSSDLDLYLVDLKNGSGDDVSVMCSI
ncbi:uncharacterized protein LOC106154481 [Lingula anatina]|uniref:Uncharacterized protein LOC106154481 n=1 Tax=Lingula anatina TaxID=7574 RepID=A0A1S3HDY8_LINAN|nr:uncharacterized protein LOC106154481 [Lingula anatina]|eukprot:XP_013384287.1 uncharacterized protein LOC106154481 [Lingula anatina]